MAARFSMPADHLLGLPLQLQAACRQVAKVVDDLPWTGASQEADVFPVAEQMSALERDAADAKAMTCGVGVTPVGDAGLRERLEATMHRAPTCTDRRQRSRLTQSTYIP